MKVYLAKFHLGAKVAYKVGITKWFMVHKRFDDPQYDKFDKIDILADIYLQHPNAKVARRRCLFIEGILKAVFKKNFRLEEHFEQRDNYFNGLSGITEMFILPPGMTEQNVVDVFKNVNTFIVDYGSKEHYD